MIPCLNPLLNGSVLRSAYLWAPAQVQQCLNPLLNGSVLRSGLRPRMSDGHGVSIPF